MSNVRVVIAAVLATTVGSLPLFLVSAASVRFQTALDFGAARYGFAVSGYFLVSALAASALGRQVHRLGPRTAARWAAVCSCGALLGLAGLAQSWAALVALLGLGAVANALGQLAANLTLARDVPKRRRAISFGAKQAAVPLAGLVVGATLPPASAILSWRWATAALALLTLVVWFGPRLPTATVERPEPRVRNPGASRAELLALTVAAACGGAAGNTLPAFIVAAGVAQGMRGGNAGQLLAVGSLMSIAVRIAAGWIADRRSSDGRTELVALLSAGAVGYGVLALSDGSLVVFVAGALVAFSAGWGWPGLMYHHVVHLFPDAPGPTTGAIVAGVYLGTIGGSALIGTVTTYTSYAWAWGVSAALVAASTAIVLCAPRLGARRA